MTFTEAEQYLLSLANIPRREYMMDKIRGDLYLKRTQYLLDLLGNPEKRIPHYIHVTGTSGKGSVATFLQAILQAAGHRTGLLTSPHHTLITERWQVNERQMSRRDFVRLTKKIKPVLDHYIRVSPYDLVSYHELMDIFGFLYFAEQRVSWAVLEVGMGGRYCSTNVIPRKEAAVITNIGWDHVELLGPTKTAIAREKAGIIKPGSLVFTAEHNKRMLDIINAECKIQNAKLKITHYPLLLTHTGAEFQYHNNIYRITAPGKHQVHNAALCIDVARALGVPETAIKRGLAAAKQPLRLELVKRQPLIILDGAHNVEKMKTTVETMKQENTCPQCFAKRCRRAKTKKNTHLVIGFSNDKLWPEMIKQLATLNPTSIACTRNTVNPFRKVAPPQKIKKEFKKIVKNYKKIKIESFLDPIKALAWSRRQCQKNDILLITGSIFLSGELKGVLTSHSYV